MSMTTEQRAAILAWHSANEAFRVAKANEAEARKVLADLVFDYKPDDLETGTRNILLADGSIIKGTFKTNVSLDASIVAEKLQNLANTSPEGQMYANRIVKWNPSLSKKEYDSMGDDLKVIFDGALTTKPATPSFEFVPAPLKE